MGGAGADVVVVGLGAMGSATAYQLAARGLHVVGVDRFSPPHTLGSTHGESRVTRQACAEGAAYVPLARRSHELWRAIEDATGTDLFTACGVVMIGPAEGGGTSLHGTPDWLARTISLAREFDIAHELLDAGAVRARYPAFAPGDDTTAYLEPGSGFVRPERAVAAQLELARRHGATLLLETLAVDVRASSSGATVITDRGTIAAGHVVVSAGPWLPTFLDDAHLSSHFTIQRQVLHWFAVADGRAAQAAPDACPVFLWSFGDGPSDFFYGFPELDGPGSGMKVATEQHTDHTTADTVDRNVAADEACAMYDRCIAGRMPPVSRTNLRSATCLYTTTPTADFVIAPHPQHPNITIVSPCSGHGFKHSAAIGEAVAQTIVDGASTIDLAPFAFPRA